MSPVILRPLTADDWAPWLGLWEAYQRFYKVDIPAETSQRTFERLLDQNEPMHGFVAVVDGDLAGLTHVVLHRSTWTIGDYAYLQDLFTDPRFRRRGVAAALIEHVYAMAEAAGCGRVYWLTHETNAEAMVLYDKLAQRSGFLQYRKLLPR